MSWWNAAGTGSKTRNAPWILGLVVLLLVAPIATRPVEADDELPPDGLALPYPIFVARPIPVGDTIWLVGASGPSGPRADILAFATTTGDTRILDINMPSARAYIGAAALDGVIYVFGGRSSDGTVYDEIVAIDTVNETVSVLPLTLPKRLWGIAAAAEAGVIHLIGGRDNANVYQSAIYTFDPEGPTLTQRSVSLPSPLGYSVAVPLNGKVYTFGGHDGTIRPYIHRFDPVANTMVRLSATLPVRSYHIGAAASAGFVYLFGGLTDWLTSLDTVYEFDGNNLVLMEHRLPVPRHGIGAGTVGTTTYLFGGETDDGTTKYDDILRFHRNGTPVPVIAPIPDAECIAGRATVVLDGRGTTTTQGGALSYEWSVSSGSIADQHAALTTANVPFGTTTVILDVSDDFRTRSAAATARVVDTLPPVATITAPRPGSAVVADFPVDHGQDEVPIIVVGDATVRASGNDACGLVSVRFSSNLGADSTDTTAPFTYAAAPSAPGPVYALVVATATDRGGLTASDEVEFWMVSDGPI